MKEKEPRPIEVLPARSGEVVQNIQPFRLRLMKVIEGADYVQKKGHNREQNYSYAMEADFLDLVKPLLLENGIIPIPTYNVIGNEQVQTQSGKPACLVTLELHLDLLDVHSTEMLTIKSIGQGRDPQDKAAYKAMTGAMKYALAKAFLIPTGDDPEIDEVKETPAPKVEKPKVKEEPVAAKKVDTSAFVKAVEKEIERIGAPLWLKFLEAQELTWPNAVLGLGDEEKRTFYKELISVKVPA